MSTSFKAPGGIRAALVFALAAAALGAAVAPGLAQAPKTQTPKAAAPASKPPVQAPAAPAQAPKAPAKAPAAPKAPAAAPAPKPVKTGALEVTVAAPAGATLQGGTVSAKTQLAPLAAAGGAVKLAGVPEGRVAVIVEAQVASGSTPAKRHLGAAETTVRADGTQKVSVTLAPFEDIETFCLGCHPTPNDPNAKPARGAIVRDVHTSGREFPEKSRERYLAQVARHNEQVAALEREGKPHHLPIVLDERVEIVAGKEVKRIFYTCESCHTLHQATPGGWYARAPFRDKSILCRGCHF